MLLSSLSGANAATTLTAWTFDNLVIGANSSPQPATGFGTASALGMGNAFNNTNSISNPDVQSLAGSSSGGANSWRIRGNGAAPNGGNGWSTSAPIGTQGARFAGSTAGYYKVKVSFDVNATADAEANLQVQYTTEGSIWRNVTNLSSAGSGVITINADTNRATVVGAYVSLASGWNNQITADLSGISGVYNNPNFAVRLVNASTGTNCVNTTGAAYNNTSGNWTFDNVVIQGISIDTAAQWTFESEGTAAFVPHPAPEFGSGTATGLGMDNSYVFSDGTVGSTNKPDVLNNGSPFSSSGAAGPFVWRVRGAGSGSGHNGWNTAAPIGTQGAEFDVSTVNFSDVVVTFDLFSTSQGEAKMCVQYTTDGSTWNDAQTLSYPANPNFILTNSPSNPNYSPDTVTGTYFYQTTGQNFYNNLVVDLTGVAGVANNPSFGIRIVNAAQNNDCVAFNGGSYNNSSGNWRYDNVTVGGTYTGSAPPVLAYDPSATVDGPFTNTFTDDPIWRSLITAVYVNGSLLTNSAYTTNTAGMMVFTPSKSALLKTSGVKSIVIYATGYGNAKVTQPLAAGVATKLAITTQPAAPAASGGNLVANPVLAVTDQYGNGTTNPYPNLAVTATVGGAGGWTLGGAASQAAVGGIATFTNLFATVNGSTTVTGAVITFTVTGYTNSANSTTVTNLNSSSFNIGAPPVAFTRGNLAVLQIDTAANNTTFSIIEVKPSAANQTSPVNIVPISATGTNGLRQSSSGSTGRLALSNDGTLVCFAAFLDDSAATADETLVLSRAAAGVNYTNALTVGMRYTSTSLGGSQARAACTLDNINWIADDKGGLFYGNSNSPGVDINANNNIVVKTFGGTPYVETQKTAGGSPIPVVYALDPNDPTVTIPNNLGTDPVATDFYMISTNGGLTYDILYVIDQISSTLGVINKYSWAPDNTQLSGFGWAASGSFTNALGADGLFATTNGNGGVYLFFTTGGGGTAGNTIVRVTDAAGWNQPMNIISTNVIYTATAGTSIKGLTFVPQQTANAPELIPPPILTAQSAAPVSSVFSVTNTPDDPTWRAAITAITVNGSTLPPAAYNKTLAGKIVFDPSQSSLLQSAGAKTIVISATGYSTNSITQTLTAGTAAKLVVTTQPTAPAVNGGLLATQPVVAVQDLFGNATTSTASILAAVGTGSWTIGGTTTKAAVSGTATFNNLTATSASAVIGATIHFTSGSLTPADSTPGFNIPAPSQPKLVGVTLSGGKFVFSFTNATGLSFSVLATNNLLVPTANWPVVGQAIESPAGSGNYQYTNSAATNAQQFYILRQP